MSRTDAYGETFSPSKGTRDRLSESYPSLHAESVGPSFPFSTFPFPRPNVAVNQPLPLSVGPVWDGSVPFAFRKREQAIDFNSLLNLDLERIVRERDLRTLQKWMNTLTYGDIKPDDIGWFTRDGQDGETSGAANAIHLFRLCQLSMEGLLHVQSFLLKSLQAKEGAVAGAHAKAAEREARDTAVIAALRKQLQAAQKDATKLRAKIDGYERHGAKIQPVTYLPAQASGANKEPQRSVYPGEVYTCALCANAFMTPQFLTQHYQRRHPGFVHPAQSVVERRYPAEEKYNAPQGLSQEEVNRQLANMRSTLEAHYASLAQKRQAELQALLARLSALESLMRGQFASQTIPKEMLLQQQQIYNNLLREIEQIKADLARDAQLQIAAENAQPHWHVQSPIRGPKTPRHDQTPVAAQAPRIQSPIHSKMEEEKEPIRPSPLAVLSPQHAISAPVTISPVPVILQQSSPLPVEPQPERARSPQEVSHLSRRDRLRQVLTRRAIQAYAPFPELPELKSRYPEPDWQPSAREEYHELELVLGELSKPENQDQLGIIEAEMHGSEFAKESYNDIYDLVDYLSEGIPPDLDLVQMDQSLAGRWQFLPTWLKLIQEYEARGGGVNLERQAELDRMREAERLRKEREDQAAAHANQIQKQQQDTERLLQEQRREQLKQQLSKESGQLQAKNNKSDLASSPSSTAVIMEQSPFDRMNVGPLPSTTNAAVASPVSPSSANRLFSPSNAASEGGSVPVQPPMIVVTSPSNLQRQGELTPAYTPLVRDLSGQGIMLSSSGRYPSRSPLPSVRPEGFDRSMSASHHGPTSLGPAVLPQTPIHPVQGTLPAKTPLSVFTPSARQQAAETQATQPTIAQQPPLQIGGTFSPSASFSSSLGSTQGAGGSNDRFGQSFGGASIMSTRSTGPGGLAHISEGGSMNDSNAQGNVSGAMNTTQQINLVGQGQGGLGSRRSSAEQEAKYGEASPSPVPIPRTEVDDEFEELLSPRLVAPRTKPSVVVAATPTAGGSQPTPTPGGVMRVSSTTNAADRFMQILPTPSTTRGDGGTIAQLPAASPASFSASTGSTLTLPPGSVTPASINPPLSTDRAGSQPGAFGSFPAATSAYPAPTPSAGPGFTPHTFTVGGHSFQFGAATTVSEPTAKVEEEDEFAFGNDLPASDNYRQQQLNESEQNASLRREEEEALGLVPAAERTVLPLRTGSLVPSVAQAQQEQFSVAPERTVLPLRQPAASVTFAQSLNSSVEETIHLPEPSRTTLMPTVTRITSAQENAPTVTRVTSAQEAAPTVLRSYSTQEPIPEVVESPPSALANLVSPTSIVSQPGGAGRLEEPSPDIPAASRPSTFAASASVAGDAVQPFEPSPAASFSSSNAVQPFVSSPSSAAASSTQSYVTAPPTSSQPTFLSEFTDEFDYGDEPAGAPVQPVTSSSSTVAPPATSSISAAPAPVPWMKAVESDDDLADVPDDDSDEEIYGRKKEKKGLDVIAPGSVSNARAQLLGSGFFLSPMNAAATGGGTPSMAQLKAARAARLGEEEGAAAATEPASSPMSVTVAKPKPAAARKNRTMPTFVMKSP